MLAWFIGTAVVAVFMVFRDPRFDYRLLVVGALLPDLIDLPGGQARWAHSLTVAVGTMALVMIVTAGRKPVRRLLLALPIGMMLHLVFDGIFSSAEVFWWPFAGSWGDVEVPSLARGWWNIPLEVVGAGLLWWSYRRFALDRADRRRDLVRRGLLVEAAPSSGSGPTC